MTRVSVVFLLLLAVCLQRVTASGLDDPRVEALPELAGANWGYQGPLGPQNWRLIPHDEMCADGQHQSPVAIEPGWNHLFSNITPSTHPSRIVPHWVSMPLQVMNNGHTIQVMNESDRNTVQIEGIEYKLTQFHFHSPAEHMVNGKQYPLEVHFVHTSTDTSHPGTAVIGVFLDQGRYSNAELSKIWKNLPSKMDINQVTKVAGVDANPNGLLPPWHDYFRYEGSLTTPPCTEGVHWVLYTTPVSASISQLQQVRRWVKESNNRPLQAINGRHIIAAHFGGA